MIGTHEMLIERCEKGDTGAQRLLAGLYLLGKGVPRDPSLAYLWLSRAGAGQQELEAVASLMSRQEFVNCRHRQARRGLKRSPYSVYRIFEINNGIHLRGRSRCFGVRHPPGRGK